MPESLDRETDKPATDRPRAIVIGGPDDVAAAAEKARTGARGGILGVEVRRRPTPHSLPLWRDVLELEEVLRPHAFAELRAQRRIANPLATAALLLATCAGIVYWAVGMQRQVAAGLAEREGRPLDSVPPMPAYLTNQHVADAWQPITIALSVGVLLAVFGIAIPMTRRFFLRHPILPVVAGAAVYLGVQQLLLLS